LPDDGKRYEIIDGELYNAPAPFVLHQRVSRKLEFILEEYVTRNQSGEVFDAPVDVVLGFEDIVQPDIIFISKENSKIIAEKNIQGVPDLVIEIVSPSKEDYDRKVKLRLYSKYKVKEYWLVWPEAKKLDKYVLRQGILDLVETYNEKEILESEIFPDLKISMERIFG
jgi:Uma2 family endonuclease